MTFGPYRPALVPLRNDVDKMHTIWKYIVHVTHFHYMSVYVDKDNLDTLYFLEFVLLTFTDNFLDLF